MAAEQFRAYDRIQVDLSFGDPDSNPAYGPAIIVALLYMPFACDMTLIEVTRMVKTAVPQVKNEISSFF